jgi:hypothetical protein
MLFANSHTAYSLKSWLMIASVTVVVCLEQGHSCYHIGGHNASSQLKGSRSSSMGSGRGPITALLLLHQQRHQHRDLKLLHQLLWLLTAAVVLHLLWLLKATATALLLALKMMGSWRMMRYRITIGIVTACYLHDSYA